MKHKISIEELGPLEFDTNISGSVENNPDKSKFLYISFSVSITDSKILDVQYVVDYTYYKSDKTNVWYFDDLQEAVDKYNEL